MNFITKYYLELARFYWNDHEWNIWENWNTELHPHCEVQADYALEIHKLFNFLQDFINNLRKYAIEQNIFEEWIGLQEEIEEFESILKSYWELFKPITENERKFIGSSSLLQKLKK